MPRSQLCLHAGGATTTLEDVRRVPVPPPEGRWHPIGHGQLYDQVLRALGNLHMRVLSEQHALAKEGKRYFAVLEIGNCRSNPDYSYVCGLRGSLDKTFAASMAFGSRVFVCDNLSFTGEITIARKYTTNIERDLPTLAGRAVSRLSASWLDMDQRFANYKTHELSNSQASDLTIRAMETGAITCQQIPRIIEEWRRPSHPEFAMSSRTAWRYFNAVTEVAKGTSAFELPRRTSMLHALLDQEVGFRPSQAIAAPIDEGMEDTEAQAEEPHVHH